MNMLIIDDDASIRESFQQIIGIFGDTIDSAGNADEAFKLIDTKAYDLIFVDYNLPDKSGLEILKHIKEKLPAAKTTMLTGSPFMKEDIARFAGADHYLQKPFEAAKIMRIINQYRKNK